jgi:hypothetical protein
MSRPPSNLTRQPVSIKREPLAADPLSDYSSRVSQQIPNIGSESFSEAVDSSFTSNKNNAVNDIIDAMADQILYNCR